MLATVIAAAAVIVVIGLAVRTTVRDRKKGVKCSGCSASGGECCRCGK